MPAYDLEVQGKLYHVEVPDPGASPLKVIVDGELFEVCLAGAGLAESVPPRTTAQARRATIAPVTASEPAATDVGANTRSPRDGISRGRDVTAPMPGTILSVEVAEGQKVQVGQVLCQLEAMKMKNPIRATEAGVVDRINVRAGQSVPHGAVLVHLTE